MAEGTARSIDPLSFHVNYVGELNKDVVRAVREGDKSLTEQLLPTELQVVEFDVRIHVSDWHASVVCTPTNLTDKRVFEQMATEIATQYEEGKLSDIDSFETFCWKLELCFAENTIPTYRIKTDIVDGKAVSKADREYHVGRYTGSSLVGLQFAAVRAAPHHYNVIMKDCVEFAKNFCFELLRFCNNRSDIEENVTKVLKRVTATGSSLETVPRRIESSGWLANFSLGGTTVVSLVAGRGGIPVFVLVLFFIFWPILTASLVFILLG